MSNVTTITPVTTDEVFAVGVSGVVFAIVFVFVVVFVAVVVVVVVVVIVVVIVGTAS